MSKSSAAQQLKALFDGSSPPQLLTIVSPDLIRRTRARDFILQKLIPNYDPNKSRGTSVEFLNASELTSNKTSNFISNVRTPSLFSKSTFWVISNLEELKANDTKPLLELFAHLPSHVRFILSMAKLPAIPTFVKVLKEHGEILTFEELKGFELNRWIEKEIKHSGITSSDQEVAELLAVIGEGSPDKISAMVEQLSLYVENQSATKEHVTSLFKDRIAISDFELIDQVGKGKYERAEMLLENFFRDGRSPFMLTGLISRTWSQYTILNYLSERGVSPSDMRTSMNLPPWLFSKHLDSARHLSSEHLSCAPAEILRADCCLKGRSGGAIVALSRLISRLS